MTLRESSQEEQLKPNDSCTEKSLIFLLLFVYLYFVYVTRIDPQKEQF